MLRRICPFQEGNNLGHRISTFLVCFCFLVAYVWRSARFRNPSWEQAIMNNDHDF